MCYWYMKKIILNEEQISQIIKLYMDGNSRKNISKKLEISEHAIRKTIEKSNLPERQYKYVGKRFGKLTVLSKKGKHKNGCPIVECICDCGNIKNIIVTNLTSSSSLTVSCGCYNLIKAISKNPWPTEYNSYISNVVKKRKFSFTLSLEEFKELCILPCFYCGCLPKTKTQVGREFRNGIDRINSKIGYELYNCVPCCYRCNKAKGTLSKEDFLKMIKDINIHMNLV